MSIYSLEEFQKAASDFARGLTPHKDRATVVGLYGELGTGKTTFVQTAARALGVSERVVSPTFLILKKFEIRNSKFEMLTHVDAYRISSGEDLRTLGFEALLQDPHNLIFVEWAERALDILPGDHTKIFFEFVNAQRRRLTFPAL